MHPFLSEFFLALTLNVACWFHLRYGYWRWHRVCSKEEKGRGRHLTASIRASHLQDARNRVGLGEEWPGPREADVAFECGRLMVKATWGPAPWFQLFHGFLAWVRSLNHSDLQVVLTSRFLKREIKSWLSIVSHHYWPFWEGSVVEHSA